MSEPIIVVYGFLRTDTLMVIEMRAAGGVNVITDNTRNAKYDDPMDILDMNQ